MAKNEAWVLAIDLGTSSVKVMAMDATRRVLAVSDVGYGVDRPHPQWAEQSSETWWRATCAAVRTVVQQLDPAGLQATGMSGQMHGAVVLGADMQPLRPAMIWMDARSHDQIAMLTRRVAEADILKITGNRPNTGFMALSLLWLQTYEPDVWRRVRHVLLPKDYLTLQLTGAVATDASDAAGTLLFDVGARAWSPVMCAAANIPRDMLPPVQSSQTVVGTLQQKAAELLGLPVGVPVVVGGGDSPCAALAGGVTEPDTLGCTIGTAAQLVWPTATARPDPFGRVASMCHVLPERWYTMGAILSGGAALAWVAALWPDVAIPSLLAEAANVSPGSDGLLFLPYLTGERSPHMDANARGCFVGLTPRHARAQMVRAVLEGVAFALNDSLTIMRETDFGANVVRLTGGAARSPLWSQILADVFDLPVAVAESAHGSAEGAALLAAMGVGLPVAPAADPAHRYQPDPERAQRYAEYYAAYRDLYPALKDSFARIARTQ